MPVHKIKNYKIVKDENGNKIQVLKSKEQWNKETCKGTKTYYFENRYTLANGERKKYVSKNFEKEREAKAEENIFLLDPLTYILAHKKGFKAIIETKKKKYTIDEIWKYMLADAKNKESTLYSYENDYNNHIKNYFLELGKYIEDIEKQDIKNWMNYINIKRKINGKEYALSFKQKNFTILSLIFSYAFNEEYIENNIFLRIKNFECVNDKVNDDKNIRYQTLREYNDFISIVDVLFWKAFFVFTFWHGPCEGEEQALKWKDIDFIKMEVTINKTLTTKVKGGGFKITNTKNRKNRTIPIAIQAQELLKELYNFYSKLDGFNDEWFVFGGIRFLPMTTMRRQLANFYDKLEQKKGSVVNRLTHHEFGRHSIASYLRNNGAKAEDVAEFLGDTPEVIEKTYYHSYKNERLERIKKFL